MGNSEIPLEAVHGVDSLVPCHTFILSGCSPVLVLLTISLWWKNWTDLHKCSILCSSMLYQAVMWQFSTPQCFDACIHCIVLMPEYIAVFWWMHACIVEWLSSHKVIMCVFMFVHVSVCEWRPEANLECVVALQKLFAFSRGMISHWLWACQVD